MSRAAWRSHDETYCAREIVRIRGHDSRTFQAVLAMMGGQPMWCCDQCYVPVGVGMVLYTDSALRGHFSAPVVVCGGRCAARAEVALAPPVKRMDWQAFLDALTSKEKDYLQ